MKGFLNLEPQYSIEIVVTSHVCVYFFSLKIQKDSKLSSADFKLEFSRVCVHWFPSRTKVTYTTNIFEFTVFGKIIEVKIL